MKLLKKSIDRFDPKNSFVTYHGAIPFKDMHKHYASADLGVFASSCENMPNILIETMAAGLPVACSMLGPMPEILRDFGCYFDPDEPDSIESAIESLLVSSTLRAGLAECSFARSTEFSWERCADSTFDFLHHVLESHS
jgi:glycosyltransferase involved in cell wall biosynthesis